eukprot:4924786-Amphidinium_carterae.3
MFELKVLESLGMQVMVTVRLKVSTEEAVGPWQRGVSYKGFSPSLKSAKALQQKLSSPLVQPIMSYNLLCGMH